MSYLFAEEIDTVKALPLKERAELWQASIHDSNSVKVFVKPTIMPFSTRVLLSYYDCPELLTLFDQADRPWITEERRWAAQSAKQQTDVSPSG